MYIPSNPSNPIDTRYVFSELKKIAISIKRIIQPESWHNVGDTGEPVFKNSWANSGTGAVASFYIDASERVYIKGHVNTGASGTVVFTLPEGYRTPEQLSFTCHTVSGGGGSGGHSYCIISVNGDVTLTMSGTSVDVSLDNISFRV